MVASYSRLWRFLIDHSMTKPQLCTAAGIRTNAMAKLGRNGDVRVEVLAKLCAALHCTMDDIIELSPDKSAKEGGASHDLIT